VGRQILEKLELLGFVNDEAFARSWVENRRLLKHVSKRRLIQEMRQKRIGDNIIEAVLAEDETDELTTLRALVARKRQQSRYQDKLKLMQYLARQGFSYDDIQQVLKD
jgi:regulatory protein